VERKKKRLERIRILDVGCGSGDGYDLIMGVTTKHPGICDYIVNAVTDDMLKEYVGIDLNENLIQQALDYYGDNPKLRFETTDISQGMLPGFLDEEPPFDLYFTSFGTLSHFPSEQCIKIIADILRHAPEHSLFMGDLLGRYTFEWHDLWHHPTDQEYFMDYRISYIYPEEERATADVAAFPLKLVCRPEIEAVIDKRFSGGRCRHQTAGLFRSLHIHRPPPGHGGLQQKLPQASRPGQRPFLYLRAYVFREFFVRLRPPAWI